MAFKPIPYLKRVYLDQKGITGLETAIILIAFVVVAAVFAYTVLSAGLFSTQKSQEAVYSGLKTAESILKLKGSVVAKAATPGAQGVGTVGQLTFSVALGAGGQPIRFSNPAGSSGAGIATGNTHEITISYIDKNQRINNLLWSKTALGVDDGNDVLNGEENYQITIGAAAAGTDNLVGALTVASLTAYDIFTIEMITSEGVALVFERTLPAHIDNVMNLH